MQLIIEPGTTFAEAVERMRRFADERLGSANVLVEPMTVEFSTADGSTGRMHPDETHAFILCEDETYDNDGDRFQEAVGILHGQMKSILSSRIKKAEESAVELPAIRRRMVEAETNGGADGREWRRLYEKKRRSSAKYEANVERYSAYLEVLEKFPQYVRWYTNIDFVNRDEEGLGRIRACAVFDVNEETILFGMQRKGKANFSNFMLVPNGYVPEEDDYVEVNV